jgi:hypothetical protein
MFMSAAHAGPEARRPTTRTMIRRRGGRIHVSEVGVTALLLGVYAGARGTAGVLGAARRLLP